MTASAPTLEAPGQTTWKARLRHAPWHELAAPVGLVLLVVVFSALNDSFLTVANIGALLTASAILILLAVGQSFVMATGGIDLSIASQVALGAVVLGLVYSTGAGILLAVIAGILTAALTGVINGLVIGKGRITDFIVTLGMMSAAQGAALIFSSGRPITVLDGGLLRFASGGIGPVSWAFLVALGVAVLAHLLLFHTRFGVHVLATGGNASSANEVGVRTQRIKFAVYAVMGLCCGLAAVLLVARVGSAEPAVNTTFLLNGIAAVVLGGVKLAGGRATILGPVTGAILLQALVNGLTLQGISQFYQPLAVGVVVVAAAFLVRFQK